ncbi:amidase [Leptolyngbya sp. FACHB-671]|uniref:amidase n=1 Tax=Leptolyngbya sp. FACHB-671 TaxID=2692812 RepID=UPI0016888409|nr:amidase [Leptolyngbya sp. FACHB-671]MBD2071342.1 amidase [Leptolyngbya sp. FACHB-671]
MNSTDLAFIPALEQARLIRTKVISPLELTQVYLDRIEQLDSSLNSFFTVMAEQAITEAKAKTEQLAASNIEPSSLPAFFGVPIAIKDFAPVAGVPCTYGIHLLKKRVATEDAGLVTRIRQAGFTILGKTATSEIGTSPYTESKGFPSTRNPWNLTYTPGGSSGGSAAAVASGLCAVAQGGDADGSVRIPAACCGLVGIKASRGRISSAPLGEKLGGFGVEGTLGRTVADAAALLDVMSGYVLGDPYWLPAPSVSFLEATTQTSTGLRIGFATAMSPIGAAHPICTQAVVDTVQLLEELGHSVEQVELNFSELIDPLKIIWQATVDVGVPRFFLGKLNRFLLKRARSRPSGAYPQAMMKLHTIARRIVSDLSKIDVLVLPVVMHPTLRVGEWAKLTAAKELENIIQWITPCPPFNVTGQPAIAIPSGFTPNGLPLGVQLVGRPGDETTIIALAAQIETARPWSQNRPMLAA